jgi:FKBP-type peptidyl-prolyl cis-trans isomerase
MFVVQVVDAVRIEEVKVGQGDEVAGPRCVAITAHTITGADGKVLERRDAGDPYIWVAGEHRAMAVGIEGMRSGGKRKITVPAAFNTSAAKLGPARVNRVPVVIEVELLNVRNVLPREDNKDGC